MRPLALTCLVALAFCSPALAAGPHGFDPPLWMSAPFALLLLAIALLPLFLEKLWHSNRNKALIAALFSAPVILYLLSLPSPPPAPGQEAHGLPGLAALEESLAEYFSFIVLLASLYTVTGGLVLQGDLQSRPRTNVAFLGVGIILANFIGTTGASMLLIRPYLQTNAARKFTGHLPVFFIFLVSNLGGLLTPLGDPPLFLGFLNGVDFFWTLSLWPHWLLANGIILAIFWIWDVLAYRREAPEDVVRDVETTAPLRLRGLVNCVFLAGILAAVLFQSEKVAEGARAWLTPLFPCPPLRLERPWGESVMIAMALLSLLLTPRGLRAANAFSWGAILEVAILFAGIFVTMIPALVWLKVHGQTLGVKEPMQYFWLTGILSSFLDNAPTYLTFAVMASAPDPFSTLAITKPLILQAISCGAVFMGANTYIGNGPNFMVKAIADASGFRTPSFFGYMLYSGLILVPTFAIVSWAFFRG